MPKKKTAEISSARTKKGSLSLSLSLSLYLSTSTSRADETWRIFRSRLAKKLSPVREPFTLKKKSALRYLSVTALPSPQSAHCGENTSMRWARAAEEVDDSEKRQTPSVISGDNRGEASHIASRQVRPLISLGTGHESSRLNTSNP